MRRHAKAPSAGPIHSQASRKSRKLIALAALALLASLALGVSLAGAIAPTVTIENAANVEYTSADVKGTVDPGDHETSYHFEAATEADFSNVSVFAGFGSLPEGAGQQPTTPTQLTELKPGTTYHLRLVASNEDGQSEAVAASTFTTKAVAAPTVTINPVTAVTGGSAHFSGTINPNAPEPAPASPEVETAFKVRWHFQCTPQCPGIEADQTIAADSSNHEVKVDATGLDHNTSYQVSLVASNAGGSQNTGPKAFKTEAVAPEAISLPAAGITETTAVIGGWVDPNGSATTYFIQYSTQPDFSNAISIPVSEDAAVGSGQKPEAVSSLVVGLQPDTNYFFQVVADSDVDSDTSGIENFQTLAVPGPEPSCSNEVFRVGPSANLPECRAFEKVTPADKNGGNISPGTVIDGDHVGLRANASFLAGDPFFEGGARYLATRHANGWAISSTYIFPRTRISDVNRDLSQEIIAQDESPDACVALCLALLPEDTDGESDVYVRNAHGVRLISKGSSAGNLEVPSSYAGQSADGSHILFETREQLEPADSGRDPAARQLYESVGGQTRVVGLDSNELPIGNGGAVLGAGTAFNNAAPAGSSDAISNDGSIIFFESPDPLLEADHQLYARINGDTTIHVSASRCSPACLNPAQPATFQGAADDGSRVYFTTAAQLLNIDSDGTTDLYQFRTDTKQLTLVTHDCVAAEGAKVECDWSTFPFNGEASNKGGGIIGVSSDGRRIYFGAPPAPAGSFGELAISSIWVYDENTGETRFAAPAGLSSSSDYFSIRLKNGPNTTRMTPDGDVLVFTSNLRLTSFDNVSTSSCSRGTQSIACTELYRYRLSTGRVDCISCNPTGAPPVGGTEVADALSRGGSLLSSLAGAQKPNQLISEDGRTIVFQSADALIPADVNNDLDIYMWRDGKVSMLSSGKGQTPENPITGGANAVIAGITGDGRDIFFTTYDQLVTSDNDLQSDLYDARISGGMEIDHPIPASPGCSGEACRRGVTGSSANVAPGSSAFSGPANPKFKRKVHCSKGKVRRNGRCARRHQRQRHGKDRTGSHNGGDNR